MKDEKKVTGPMSIGRTFTASMGEKANLRKFIEGWFGKKMNDESAADFDLSLILGRKCLLNVTHSEKPGGKTYANVVAASPIPKGMPTEYVQHNPSLFYDLDSPDETTFKKLPNWLQEKIEAALKRS